MPQLALLTASTLLLLALGPSRAYGQEPTPAGATMTCEQVECRCVAVPAAEGRDFLLTAERGCAEVTCRCLRPAAGGAAGEPAPVLEPPRAPPGLDDRPPPPLGGETLGRGRFGVEIKVGYPHLGLHLGYGLRETLELGIGYESFLGLTHTPSLTARVRLFRATSSGSGLALGLRFGSMFVLGGSFDGPYFAGLIGGDFLFGEALLSASFGRGGQAFTLDLGLRLGSFRTPDSSQAALVVAAPFVEFGYARRFARWGSFFITTGGEGRIGLGYPIAGVRGRLGVRLAW